MASSVFSSGAALTTGAAWREQWREKYATGGFHSFIFHLGVKDLVSPDLTVVGSVAESLVRSRFEIVAFYDRAHGFTFASTPMRNRFIEVTGLNAPTQGDSALSALFGQEEEGEKKMPTSPGECLRLMEAAMKSVRCGFIILDAETVFPDAPVASIPADERSNLVRAAMWGSDKEIAATGSTILLMAEQLAAVNVRLRQASARFEAIRVDLPDLDARRGFVRMLNRVIDKAGSAFYSFAWEEGFNEERFAVATAGLTLTGIQDIYLRAKSVGRMSYTMVIERKREIIAAEYGDVLEWVDPRWTFDAIGGHEHIKRILRATARKVRENRLEGVSKGFLLAGPPGTGKSVLVEAFAGEVGFNMVSLNMSRILGSFVGQSEQNLERALVAIRSLAPCIVFMDEIDQKVSRSEGAAGDSGVGARVFSRLMEFLADPTTTGRVIAFAATNRPDLIDAAFKRPGRFDVKLPVLAPDRDERAAVLGIHMERRGLALSEITDNVLDATEGFTQAELERLAKKAVQYADDGHVMPLERAASRLIAGTGGVQRQTVEALAICDDPDNVPDRFFDLWRQIQRQAGRTQETGQNTAPIGAADATRQTRTLEF